MLLAGCSITKDWRSKVRGQGGRQGQSPGPCTQGCIHTHTHVHTNTHKAFVPDVVVTSPAAEQCFLPQRTAKSKLDNLPSLFLYLPPLSFPSLLTFHLVLYLFSSSYFISYIHPLPKLLFLPPFFLLLAYIHVFIWFLRSRGSLRSLAAVCGRTTLTSASFTPPLSPERVGRAGHSTTAVLPDVLQLFHSVVRDCSVFCKLWFALTAVGVCLEGHSYICVRKKHWRCVWLLNYLEKET